MTTELGTELGTSLGTILASMEDAGIPTFDTSKIYGVTQLTSTNVYQTPASGGESGDAAGFGYILLYWLQPTAGERMFGRYTTGQGYVADRSASLATIGWNVTDGSAALKTVTVTIPGASSFGQIVALVMRHNGTTVDGYAYGQPKPTPLAITGFTSSTQPQLLRGATGATSAPLGVLTYRGVPTDPQIEAVLFAARTLGNLPSKAAAEALMPGVTVTHRWSVKDALAAPNLPVADGAAGPASIADTVTNAAGDLMAKSGSPIVRVLDPNAYPRTGYGVLGFADTNYLESAAGAGIQGTAAGFHVVDVIVPRSLTGTQMYAHSLNDAGNRGWYFQSVGAALKFSAESSGGVETASSAYTLTTADLGSPLWIAGQVDAAGIVRLFVRGVQAGADSAAMGTFGPSTTAMRVGIWKTASGQATGADWLGLAGGSNVTAGELAQNYAAYVQTGRIQPIAGKSEHLYDPTLDAAGGSVPTQVRDRIGADPLTRQGGITASSTTGLSKCSTTQFAQTAALVTPGVATGFYAECLVDVTTLSGQQGYFAATSDAGFTNGFVIANNAGKLNVWGGGGTVAAGANLTLGTRHLALRYDGTALRAYVDGVSIGTSGAYTHVPTTVATTIGGIRASSILWPVASDSVRGAAYGPGVVSDGQIAAAASAALTAGKIVGIAGVTTKMWSPVDDVASAGGAVPLRLVERVSGAGADAMLVANPKLEVSTRTERLWSYETTPILRGAETLTLTDYFETLINQLPGDAAAGFTVSLLGVVTSQSVTGGRHFAQRGSGNPGWEFLSQGSNASVAFSLGGGTTSVLVSSTIAAGDVGKLGLYTGVWDPVAGMGRLYAKRAQVGTGTTLTGGFAPDAAVKAMLGRRSAGNPALGFALYGAYYALGVPTLAQVQAQFDLVLSTERIQPIAALGTGVLVDLVQDTAAGGVPATLTDRGAGGINFTRVGAPTLAQQYARAWTW